MIVPGSSFIFGEVCNDPTCDPYWDNVVLAMHMDGTDNGTTFTDEKGKTVTRFGNTVTETGVKKFGTSSTYFDGTGDYLAVPDSVDFVMDSSDYTVECFFATNTHSSLQSIVGHITTEVEPYKGWVLRYAPVIFPPHGVRFVIFHGVGISPTVMQYAWVPTLGLFYHIAVTKVGNTIRIFIDGLLIGETVITAPVYSAVGKPLTIGAHFEAAGISHFVNGYIDDLRITKGVARYTSNFTPPCRAFPNSVC
jgi:hypothetical protein